MGRNYSLKDLIESGTLNVPAKIQAIYKGYEIRGMILKNGSVRYKGKEYNSLSVAAGKAVVDAGMPPAPGLNYRHINGWTFWKFHSSGRLISLAEFRKAVK